MMKEILSLFLALCSLLGSAADGVEPKETSIGQEILSSLSSLVLPGQEESRSALPYGEMRYVHYDPQAFYDGIDRMRGMPTGPRRPMTACTMNISISIPCTPWPCCAMTRTTTTIT